MMNKQNTTNNQSPLEPLEGIRLTDTEKTRMRAQVEEHAENNQPVVWGNYVNRIRSLTGQAAVMVATVLFALGGLTYAAEDALPGSPLYAVKTNVNESFLNLTSLSDSRTAQTQSELAARRIDELQELLANNKLTTTTSEDLLSDIKNHTRLARKSITDLRAAGESKSEAADQLNSRLQALLAAEGEQIKEVAERDGKGVAGNLAEKVAQQLVAIAENSTTTNTSKIDLPARKAVLNLLQTTTAEFAEVYNNYRQQKNVDETPPPKQLVSAAHNLQLALDDIEDTSYAPAVSELDLALEAIKSARVNLRTNAATGTVAVVQTKDKATETTGVGGSPHAVTTSTRPTSSRSNLPPTPNSLVGESDNEATPAVTKQFLYNQQIQEVLKSARTLLQDAEMQVQDRSLPTATSPAATTTNSSSGSVSSQAGSTTSSTTTQKKKRDDEPSP